MKGRPSGRNGEYMVYIKHYHDNVRHVVKSITIYTQDQLDIELSTITYTILDTLTDHNADMSIYDILADYTVLAENEDDVEPDTYDALFDEFYQSIYSRLESLLDLRGYVRAGDYDIMTKDLYDKEVYSDED